MPKHLIRFNLPEDQDELNYALRGSEYYCKLYDLYQLERKLRKYDDRKSIPKDEVINLINEILQAFEL